VGAHVDIRMSDFFESNYATLTQQAPALAQRLRTSRSRAKLKVLQSRAGAPVFKVRNITLHSLYDPQAEASQWAASTPDTTRPCVVLGFGNGYHLEGLHAGPVIVVEPDVGLLRKALEV
jgi:hypothetical protein